MGPGMIEFFKHAKETILIEGVDEAAFTGMFSGIKGFVILDTCGNIEKVKKELEEADLGVPILETRKVGLENVKRVVFDAIQHAT